MKRKLLAALIVLAIIPATLSAAPFFQVGPLVSYNKTVTEMQESTGEDWGNINNFSFGADIRINPLKYLSIDIPATLGFGNEKSVSIAAASILAKVTRDRIMKQYDERYPQYGFARHKGYPTKAHLQALHEYGVLPIHRRSYGPVREALMPHLELSFDD